MDLYEVEGKALFKRFGIPVDSGALVDENTKETDISFPCVLKAQVLSGKRGKAGGIKKVHNMQEFEDAYREIMSLTIGGKPVNAVLAVPMLRIEKEHYLGITLDPFKRQRVLIYSPEGGMDIEQLAIEQPDKLLRLDVTDGVDTTELVLRIEAMGVEKAQAKAVTEIAEKLFKLYIDLDATTAEINPLAQLTNSSLIAADAKLVVDNSALYRQPDLTLIEREVKQDELDRLVEQAGISYVEINSEGNVGLVVSGAGLGMATFDTASYYGLEPCDFTDLGSRMNAECVKLAIKRVLRHKNLKGIIINGFGGMYTTTEMISWIKYGMEELKDCNIPVVVKLRGNKQEEGWLLLEQEGIPYVGYGTTDEVVELMIGEMEARK